VANFASRVIDLNRAAWALREAAPRPSDLPFALALFSDPERMPPAEEVARALPTTDQPLAFIFRHDHLRRGERLALAERVRDLVQARGHLFILARDVLPGADGSHGRQDLPSHSGLHTAPVHDEDEIVQAILAGAQALFLSPLQRTASHVGQAPLPSGRAIALAQACPAPIFALGGMNEERAERLQGTPFQGFGAIDAFFDGLDGNR